MAPLQLKEAIMPKIPEEETQIYMLLGSMSADLKTVLNKFTAVEMRLNAHSERLKVLEKDNYARAVVYTTTITITPILFTALGWLLTKTFL